MSDVYRDSAQTFCNEAAGIEGPAVSIYVLDGQTVIDLAGVQISHTHFAVPGGGFELMLVLEGPDGQELLECFDDRPAEKYYGGYTIKSATLAHRHDGWDVSSLSVESSNRVPPQGATSTARLPESHKARRHLARRGRDEADRGSEGWEK